MHSPLKLPTPDETTRANMTDVFLGHKEDLEQYCEEAEVDIKAITDASSTRAREEAIMHAENSVAEAERYLRILESDARSGDTQQRQKMLQMMRTCKTNVNNLKSLLEKNKLLAVSQKRRDDQLTDSNEHGEGVYIQMRLDGAGNLLDESKQLIADSEARANNTTTQLAQQRDQLTNVDNNVTETQEDAVDAGAHLVSLKRKQLWKIFTLYFVMAVLSAHIIYRIIRAVA